MSWARQLRGAFAQLRAGERPARLSLDDPGETLREIETEFNALVKDVEIMRSKGRSREEVHGARNRLAGILAALQVMIETDELSGEDKVNVTDVIAEAKKLDAQLRHG